MRPEVMFWEGDDDLPDIMTISKEINDMYVKDLMPMSDRIRRSRLGYNKTYYDQKEFEYELSQFYRKFLLKR